MTQVKTQLKVLLIGAWLVFTVSLAVWWYIYSRTQLARIALLSHGSGPEIAQAQSMLTWEGAALIFSLILGGGALVWLVLRDGKRQRKVTDFYLTFSHELKTPLASIQLQAESLMEDLGNSAHSILVGRILRDTRKLAAQLENSLYLQESSRSAMVFEKVSLQQVLESLQHEFPDLHIEVDGEEFFLADEKIVKIILRNIFLNTLQHGKATAVSISAEPSGAHETRILIRDNGKGFGGSPQELTKPFERHYRGSGNGLGLYVSSRLARILGGKLAFPPCDSGFTVSLFLPRYREAAQ